MPGPAAAVPATPRTALPLLIVVLASLVAGWLVFTRLLLPGPPVSWDEAAHALRGLLIAHDVRQLDVLAFFHDSYRQVYWPPIHSWLVGAAILIAGPSIEAARFVGVASFVLLAPILFLTARTLQARNANLAGGVAAALALTSPGIIANAPLAMLELPGLLTFSCSLLVYCRVTQSDDAPPRAHLLLGVLIMVTYLVKANYGILLIISIVLAKLAETGLRPRRLLTKQNFYAALPVVVISALWFAYPPKLVAAWNALVNQPFGGAEVEGVGGLLFYPLAIARLAGSAWIAGLLGASLAAAWKWRRRSGIALLIVVAVVLLLIGTFHHTKMSRHILPLFPALFVLSGVAAAELWARVSRRGRTARMATVALLAITALLHARVLAGDRWQPPLYPQRAEMLSYISSVVRRNAPALVLGTIDSPPAPPIIDWHLAANERLLPVTAAWSVMDPDQQRRMAEALSRGPLPERLRGSARVLERYERTAGTRSLHLGIPVNSNRAQFESELTRTLSGSAIRTVIAITSTSDSARYSIGFIDPGVRRAGFGEASVEEFAEARARVYVYQRR